MCSWLSNPYNINSLASYFCSLLSSLSLFSDGHCMCSWLSNPYNVASRARCIICVHGYLTHIISTALLPTFACCFPLSLFSDGHFMCSWLSNSYNVASRARCIICVHGYLTHIISKALLPTFAHCFPLSLFSDGHYMCSRLSNPYNINSLASHVCLLLSSLSLL